LLNPKAQNPSSLAEPETNADRRVFIVDDDSSVLRAVARLLRASGFVVQTFSTPQSFLEFLPYNGPAALVLDMRMPDLSGLDLQGLVADRAPAMAIVFLSGASDVPTTARAMRNGAVDFLVKPFNDEALIEAVSRAMAASVQIDRRRREQDVQAVRLSRLTPRERQVCQLVARGLANKQIAYELGASEKTIKVHRGRVMHKLEVDSVAQLVWLLSARSQT
jgi:FixJ family two-component response regulator